jgi:hypothetical protein
MRELAGALAAMPVDTDLTLGSECGGLTSGAFFEHLIAD